MTGPGWRWTEEQLADLRAAWPLGEPCASIGARIGKSAGGISAKAHEIGLPARRPGKNQGRSRGPLLGRQPMKPELPQQAEKWGSITFEDAAVRSEGMLRGLPPVNLSAMTTCAAALADA
jgi:hypothetical protein